MPDYGAMYADMSISAVEKELRRTYRTAQKELKKKLADFNKRFAAKDREMKGLLREGAISKQDYKDWMLGQVFVRKQWQDKIRQVNEVIFNFNKQAMKLINERKLSVFAENYNYQAFLAEKAMVLVRFDIYNTEAVARLILDKPQLLPQWKIDKKKDYEWNYQKVNNIIKQGIIQGESIDEITDRLCRDLATQNENRMRTFARTAMTGAQNAGRQQQMEDAAKMGIDVHKKWLAIIDARTRDAHVALDGQEVPYNKSFSSDLGEIRFPGDPSAKPANTYNCRCTMVTIYPKYEDRSAQGVRRAYDEYVDKNGNAHRYSYLTANPAEYREWKARKGRRDNK